MVTSLVSIQEQAMETARAAAEGRAPDFSENNLRLYRTNFIAPAPSAISGYVGLNAPMEGVSKDQSIQEVNIITEDAQGNLVEVEQTNVAVTTDTITADTPIQADEALVVVP